VNGIAYSGSLIVPNYDLQLPHAVKTLLDDYISTISRAVKTFFDE
jgi:hypothetical protein